MEKVRIKICGLSRPEDIAYVNEAQPDYAGFIINVPKSIRSITLEQARELIGNLSPQILPVAVFRNNSQEEILAAARSGLFALIQLHGHEGEDEDFIRRIQSETGLPVIRAFNEKTMDQAASCSADYILLDHASGGTGETFDWSLAGALQRPFFLAGGIGPDNIENAVRRVHPWAVDLSSKVETDGHKDREKILQVTDLVRKINKESGGNA
jgi:phosphoribosylanthranilate isomerase